MECQWAGVACVMAENHTLPADLIRLQTAYRDSDAAVAVYVTDIEAAQRLNPAIRSPGGVSVLIPG